MESSNTPSPEDIKTVQTLAKGLLELYEPPLTTINTHLKELTEKQEAVQGMITSERRRLEDLQNDAMLDALAWLTECSIQSDQTILNASLPPHCPLLSRPQPNIPNSFKLADIATNKEKLVTMSNSMMTLHKRVQALSVRAANVEKAARSKASQSHARTSTS